MAAGDCSRTSAPTSSQTLTRQHLVQKSRRRQRMPQRAHVWPCGGCSGSGSSGSHLMRMPGHCSCAARRKMAASRFQSPS
eukprot:11195100-Alexandrium_andersonii.AAC.1